MSHETICCSIQNLKVCAGEKEILHGIDLDIHENEVHVLMGPNGTGKSTLGAALMGNPAYTVTGGDIFYKGDRTSTRCRTTSVPRTAFSCRSRTPSRFRASPSAPLSAAHWRQRPASAFGLFSFKKELEEKMELLQMDPSYAERDLNVGFLRRRKEKD